MDTKPLALIIIATEKTVPKGLGQRLKSLQPYSITFKTTNPTRELKKLNELNPSLFVVENKQIKGETTTFLVKLKLFYPDSKVLVITEVSSLGEWLEFLKIGVRGILQTGFEGSLLLKASQVVQEGGIFLDSKYVGTFITQCEGKVKKLGKKPEGILTDQEKIVLKLIAVGYTSKKTASILKLSSKTVDTHTANLMRKTHIHHRTDLIKYALRNGIISLEG
ncbi:MAG TPA: response regulator transcription factor [Nitrospiria bacterium]|jgi:DNA-binding NarL/FixJ family response regulator